MKYEKIKLFIYRISNGFSLLKFCFTINISNICNRTCKFCPNFAPELEDSYYLQWFRKQPDLMNYEKFANMLKRMGILRFFIKDIAITGRGDPTLHPDLLKFCRIVNYYKISFTITSNGDKMTPEFFHEVGKLEYLDYVRVSLFNVEKAKYWLDLQEKNNVKIEFQNETGTKIDAYADGYISSNNPGTAKYSTMPLNFVTEIYCRHPFSFNTLNTDGTLVPCITFVEVGNAFKESFWKIWNGKKMRSIRKQALKMAIPKHLAYCRDCGVFMQLPKYKAMNNYEERNINLKKRLSIK